MAKQCAHCGAEKWIKCRGLCEVCYANKEVRAKQPRQHKVTPEHLKAMSEGFGADRARRKTLSGGPKPVFVDEPEAPEALRAARWIAFAGKNARCETGTQEGLKVILADNPREFFERLKTLEEAWAAEKVAKNTPGPTPDVPSIFPLPGILPPPEPVPLDEVSKRVVDQIDRWFAEHSKRAKALHPE